MVQRGMITEDSGWYEAGLPLVERKKRGHFSTPPLLVEHILDACGYSPETDLTHLRVLDPACGSGNFLVGAARRLMAFGERAHLSRTEIISLVERNLWGFDPDPVSCFLAEIQLRSVVGNVPPYLHIHQADSLVLPWEPCVDLFVANPPYLAAKNNDLSGYRSVHGRGQADSYLLFLNQAFQVVRPGGWIGLVLPDPLLARANAARERARLLQEVALHHLWHLAGVFAADVGAVVIIGQRCAPRTTHRVSWIRERWSVLRQGKPFGREGSVLQQGDHKGPLPTFTSSPAPTMTRGLPDDFGVIVGAGEAETRRGDPCGCPGEERGQAAQPGNAIAQSLFLSQPGAELRYLLSSEHGTVIERLRAILDDGSGRNGRLAPLGDFLTICRGEEIGRENPLLVEMAGGPTDSGNWAYPILRGGIDIHPYRIPRGHWQIARDAIVKPLERYLSPKLLVVKSTDQLQATLDLHGHVALQTLYLLHLRDKSSNEDSLYFFLALLNSRLLREYVYVLHTAYKWVQPQIEQRVLAHLPVPVVRYEERQQVIEQAKSLVSACSKPGAVVEWDERIIRMYEEQERAICALYDSVLPGLFDDVGTYPSCQRHRCI